MPLIETKGAASAQGFGEFARSAAPVYIEDVFSTWLYTGNNSNQAINTGIGLTGANKGLVWNKARTGTPNHAWFDTARGTNPENPYYLASNSTGAQTDFTDSGFQFTSTGFLAGNSQAGGFSGFNYVSWTFKTTPKFFDVVTYTGTGSARTVAHNLGSVPGCMIIKCTSTTSAWFVYHRSLDPGGNPASAYLALNTTAAADSTLAFTNTQPTSSVFYVGDGVGQNPINQNGATYVAYLFAHNAGGFGASGSDNVISCGSFTMASGFSPTTVNLGYEPQWVMMKSSTSSSAGDGGGWLIMDNMRGLTNSFGMSTVPDPILKANTTAAENNSYGYIDPTSTGFITSPAGSSDFNQTFIYIAIRRGPMKVPTSGTSVFSPNFATSTTGQQITTGFPVDSQILRYRPAGVGGYWFDRPRGVSTTSTESGQALYPNNTNAETLETYTRNFNNTGYQQNSGWTVGTQMIGYSFGRAPGFFDVVCYTGTGAGNNVQIHNLTVAPEILIVKNRSFSELADWYVFHTFTAVNFKRQFLSTTAAESNTIYGSFLEAQPTTTNFILNNGGGCNASGTTYVAYLFATCAGVSKVGSYTGTGTTQTINCGFTGGARFVMIKRTDSTGDWYVWDSARGIVAGDDPYLLLNSTAAEVTGTDYVDTFSAGFEISSTAPAAINANGGTFIFLAIA